MKKKSKQFRIGNKLVGENVPCFVIAEIGGNHGGKISLAYKMIDAAFEAGADAVKFQTYITEDFAVPSYPGYKNLEKEALSFDDFRKLAHYCHRKKVIFLSTPFDLKSVDLLAELNVPAYKVASGDINNFPLLEYIADQGKLIILSTGASTIKEVEQAVAFILRKGQTGLALLHCLASYPAPDREINLLLLPEYIKRFGVAVGFSDHSEGIDISLASAALGAKIIEKHFTINKNLPGGDNSMSLLPDEFKRMVQGIRRIETSLGKPGKKVMPSERMVRKIARRSLVALRDISRGETFDLNNIGFKRPSSGLDPKYVLQFLSKSAKQSISKDKKLALRAVDK